MKLWIAPSVELAIRYKDPERAVAERTVKEIFHSLPTMRVDMVFSGPEPVKRGSLRLGKTRVLRLRVYSYHQDPRVAMAELQRVANVEIPQMFSRIRREEQERRARAHTAEQ